MALSNDIAVLLGFGCGAVFYGAYCVLFILSCTILFNPDNVRNVNRTVVFFNLFLFFLCTTHFGLEFNHFYTTLQKVGVDGFARETTQFFGADVLISVTDLVGDFFLLYRCWTVWNKNYFVIILPFLCAVSGFGCIMEALHLLLVIDPTSSAPPASLIPLGIAGYTLPLCTNVLVTGLIVYRIYFISRGIPSAMPGSRSKGRVRQAISVVVESGLLYMVTQVIFVTLFALGHPAQGIMAVVATQVYGIAPTLIIIRVGLGISTGQTTANTNGHTGNNTNGLSWAPNPSLKRGDTTAGTFTVTGGMTSSDIELGKTRGAF